MNHIFRSYLTVPDFPLVFTSVLIDEMGSNVIMSSRELTPFMIC